MLAALLVHVSSLLPCQQEAPPGATTAPATDAQPAPLPEGAPALLAEITAARLSEHAHWLADDARRGRYTGSKAQQETADYVQRRFQELGLLPLGDKKGYLQAYPLESLLLHASSSVAVAGVETKDFGLLVSPGLQKAAVSGKIAFCGKGRDDEIPAALQGKVPVVVFDKVPRGQGPGGDFQAIQLYVDLARKLASRQAKLGVVLLPGDPGPLGNTVNYFGLMPDHGRHQYKGSEGMPRREVSVPLCVVAGKAAEQMLAALGVVAKDGGYEASGDGKKTAKVSLRVDRTDKGSATNVVALLEGTSRKAEALVFSAHHDHVGRRLDGDAFNGADDNASGTAALLTIAEAFARAKERPARSILFLSVSGEELGLWGSKRFVDHPTWPLDRIIADVNIDMIGRPARTSAGLGIQLTPSKEHPRYSTLGRLTAQLAPSFGISFSSGDAYYERSDHFNFAEKGIPVVFLCDGEHPDYHQVSDHADKLDYPGMEAIARLLCWTGWETANGKDRPKELGKQAQW